MPVMSSEKDESYSQDARWHVPVLKTRTEVLNELARPCSRFTFDARRSGGDWWKAQMATKFDPLAGDSLILGTDTPANWQLFANYLYGQNILSSPKIYAQDYRNDVPRLHVSMVNSIEKTASEDGDKVNRGGLGASFFDKEESVSKAFGELLERFFLAKYKNADMISASYKELKSRRFGPRPLNIFELNGFFPWQEEKFPRFKRSEDDVFRWVRAKNIPDGGFAYIPAQLMYWNYSDSSETCLGESNTDAAAGHFTREEAILGGLLEYIQRDGFMIHWLKIVSPRRIDLSTIDDSKVKSVLDEFTRCGLTVHLIDTTTDVGVPSCVSVLVDERKGKYHTIVAGGAGFTLPDILLSALGELIVVYNGQKFNTQDAISLDGHEPFIKPKIGHIQRIRIWQDAHMYKHIQPFLEGPLISAQEFMKGVERYATTERRIAFILDQFKKLGEGYEAYVYEVDNAILRSIGYHVVQVLVPRMMHLYLNETNATLAAPRLSSVPAKLGYIPRKGFNPWPHPFP